MTNETEKTEKPRKYYGEVDNPYKSTPVLLILISIMALSGIGWAWTLSEVEDIKFMFQDHMDQAPMMLGNTSIEGVYMPHDVICMDMNQDTVEDLYETCDHEITHRRIIQEYDQIYGDRNETVWEHFCDSKAKYYYEVKKNETH